MQHTEKLAVSHRAEENVIACILGNPYAIKKVADTLQPEHFFVEKHVLIYKAALKLEQQGRRCTIESVEDELERQGKLQDAGGSGYLYFTGNSVALLSDVEEEARVVIRKAVMRNLFYAAQEIAQLAQDEDEEAAERAMEIISNVALGAQSDTIVTFSDAVDEYMADLKQRMTDLEHGIAHGLPTGFADLDHALGGLQRGHFCTIGALTGNGKSALAQNIALNIALNNKHVLFFSLEMPRNELVQRALSIYAEKDQSLLRDALINENEYATLNIHANRLRQCDIKIDDSSFTIKAIQAKIKQVHARKKLDLIVVDYLQLIENLEKSKNTLRTQEIADMSRALKRMAQQLNVPVVALVQLNREFEKGNQPPKLADINESGSVARDSNEVLLIYVTQEEMEKREQNQTYKVIVRIAKNRGGRMGEVPLMFSPRITKFKALEVTPGADYDD